MKVLDFWRTAISGPVAAALLSACGGLQLPTSIPHVELSAPSANSPSRVKDHGYKVLYDFQGVPDGSGPGGLTMVNGTFYGTTQGGGSCYYLACGTVFEITPSGIEQVIYRFKGGSDGNDPVGNLVNVNGTLYGVTNEGGSKSGPCAPPSSGCGTVFKVSTAGDEHVLYRFKGGKDGDYPLAGLTSLDGMLYGTTDHGGGYYGLGTVFQITLTGREKILYRFKGGASDGWGPQAPLLPLHGTLY
ncbi:MAG: choice-of-anchor tandem repeat GloVer-containing protein, partial [Candidatus Cybelea sp.]